MLKNHSSLSHSPTKTSSPSKLFHYKSNADLSPRKGNKKGALSSSVPTSPVKAHPTVVFTEERVWNVEMQTVADVMSYFCGVTAEEIDVGMVKKLWQLLRNETVEWIQSFLRDGGFAVILGVLKDVLAIEWRFVSTRPALLFLLFVLMFRNEKDDAVLHQILLCLKALSTTDVPSLQDDLNRRLASANYLLPRRLCSHS